MLLEKEIGMITQNDMTTLIILMFISALLLAWIIWDKSNHDVD